MKLIKTKSNNYLYDSYSNSIVKIEDINEVEIGKVEIKEEIRNHLIENKIFSEVYEPDFIEIDKEEIRNSIKKGLNHIILNVTEKCNLQCKYCAFSGIYQHKRHYSDYNMTDKVALKSIDFFMKRNTNSKEIIVGFYGGEPLLNFSLIKRIVNEIKEKHSQRKSKIRFSMTTNGTLLKNEILEFLVKNNFKISVSLDGPKEIHDKWRVTLNGNPTYDLITSNLYEIKKNYPEYYNKIVFEATVTPPYDLLRINHFFINNELTKKNMVRLSFVNTYKLKKTYENKKSSINTKINECISYIKNCLQDDRVEDTEVLLSLFFPTLKRIHNREKINKTMKLNINGICNPISRRLFVDRKGKVYLCEKLDYFISFGSVYKGIDYKKIFKILDIYRNAVIENCKACWARYFCNACFKTIADKNKIDINLKFKYCSSIKNRIEKLLSLYLSVYEQNPEILKKLFSEHYENN